MSEAGQTYKSGAHASVHELISDLHDAGLVDKRTMRRFDDSCLVPVEELSPEDIRRLRDQEGVSQGVFARYLNVSTSVVGQWERGEKRPAGSSLKLLNLVRRHGLETIR